MLEARPGTTLHGRYRLESRLGGGGAASVWRALDNESQRHVAVKLLHPKHRAQPTVRDRLSREAELLSRFEHPHIARALSFAFDYEQPYFVMELIEGRSMQDELADRAGPDRHFSAAQLLRLVGEAAEAVDYAHRQGVVHRDLKPANIMLADGPHGPTVKVLDFGIAKLLENTDPLAATTRGRILGSGFYMAPEQALGQGVTARSDLFALSSVVIEMLTLRRAWVRGEDGGFVLAFAEPARMNTFNEPSELLRRLARHPRPKVTHMRADLPTALDAVFERGLAIEPAERYESVATFFSDFEAALPEVWGEAPRGPSTVAKTTDTEPNPAFDGSDTLANPAVAVLAAPTIADEPPPGSRTGAREAHPPPLRLPDEDAQVEPQPLDANYSPSQFVTHPGDPDGLQTVAVAGGDATLATPSPQAPPRAATAGADATVEWPAGPPMERSPAPRFVESGVASDPAALTPTPTPGARPLPPPSRGRLATVGIALVVGVAAFAAGRLMGPPEPETVQFTQPAAPAEIEVAPRPGATAAPAPPPPAEAAAAPTPPPPRSAPARRAPARAKAEPPASPASPARRALASLKRRLDGVRKDPSNLEALSGLSRAIQAEAVQVSDPKVRTRIRRVAASSALVGDVEGVARALALLEASL